MSKFQVNWDVELEKEIFSITLVENNRALGIVHSSLKRFSFFSLEKKEVIWNFLASRHGIISEPENIQDVMLFSDTSQKKSWVHATSSGEINRISGLVEDDFFMGKFGKYAIFFREDSSEVFLDVESLKLRESQAKGEGVGIIYAVGDKFIGGELSEEGNNFVVGKFCEEKGLIMEDSVTLIKLPVEFGLYKPIACNEECFVIRAQDNNSFGIMSWNGELRQKFEIKVQCDYFFANHRFLCNQHGKYIFILNYLSYESNTYRFFGVILVDGQILWETCTPSELIYGFVIHKGYIVFSYGDDSKAMKLNTLNGELSMLIDEPIQSKSFCSDGENLYFARLSKGANCLACGSFS